MSFAGAAYLCTNAVDGSHQVADRIRAVQAQRDSTCERLALFFELSADAYAQCGPMHRDVRSKLILMNVGSRNLGATRDAMVNLLQEGIDRRDVAPGHSAATLAEVVLGTFYRIVGDWTIDPTYKLHEQLSNASRFLSDAIAPD